MIVHAIASLLLVACLPTALGCQVSGGDAATIERVRLDSPDGRVQCDLAVAAGEVTWRVVAHGEELVAPSTLGLLVNGRRLGANVASLRVERRYETDARRPWRGGKSEVLDRSRALVASVCAADGARLDVELRVGDTGVAFRYLVAGTGSVTVTDDLTQFAFPVGSQAWAASPHEEAPVRQTRLSDDGKAFERLAVLPMTLKTPAGTYLTLLEANRRGFPGLRHVENPGGGRFKARIAGSYEAKGKLVTPWRTVLIASSLDALVNADHYRSLADQPSRVLFPRGSDTAWLQSGRLAWSWFGGGGAAGITLARQKEWVELGRQLGYEYVLVDEGWYHWGEDGVPSCGDPARCKQKEHGEAAWQAVRELVAYAASCDMKVWLWKAWGDRRNIAGIHTEAGRRSFFEKCRRAGIVGLKIDFFPAPTQHVLRWQTDALEDAARMRLMLNFHGCAVPTGEAVTWPNEMTREAMRCLEYYGMEHAGGLELRHDIVSQPFTRMLAGHADLTPLRTRSKQISVACHVAASAVFESSVFHVSDHPRRILDMGADAVELIRSVPFRWDETRVLAPSEIGRLAVYARRHGETWFLAILGGPEPVELSVPLGFLGSGSWRRLAIADGEASAFRCARDTATASDVLRLRLQPGGGYLARFERRD